MHLPVRIWIILIWLFVLQYLVLCQEDTCCVKLEKRLKRDIKQTCSCKKKLDCPFGFIRYKGVCYWFIMGHYEVKDWWHARNICNNHGGNLVTVNHRRRKDFVLNHLRANFKNNDGQIKMFTGLIYTDGEANNPHVPTHTQSSPVGDSVRWSSTGEFVQTKDNSSGHRGKQAQWSPDIQDNKHGPGSQIFLSCIVMIWEPKSSSKLIWRYNDCLEKNLKLICEVRLAQAKSKRPKRSLSSHYSDVFGINDPEDVRTLDEDDDYDDFDDDDADL